MKQNKSNINKRPITSDFALVSFLYLVPSGVLDHFAIKYGNVKFNHAVASVHWMAAVIFLISIISHLILNRKALAKYMFSKIKEASFLRKEFIIALLVTTSLIALFGTHALHI